MYALEYKSILFGMLGCFRIIKYLTFVLIQIVVVAPNALSQPHFLFENFNNINKSEVLSTVNKEGWRFVNSSIKTFEDDKVLVSSQTGWAALRSNTMLSCSQGSISVWVNPQWNKEAHSSHTIMSFRWDGTPQGYFSLSQGWWEPAGKDYFYAILNNQEHLHLKFPDKLAINFWTNIIVTWKSGKKGFFRLYIDGKMVRQKRKAFSSNSRIIWPLYIGSDQGTGGKHKRSFNGYFDNLMIFSYPLNDSEISCIFHKQIKKLENFNKKQISWMNDVLKQPVSEKRTNTSKLIETRAIFDEGIDWATSRSKTDEILSRIKQAGFNVYVPCVWHGKGTYYRSPVANYDIRLKKRMSTGDDPLEYLIQKAHSMGLEVHPWFTVVKRSNSDYPQFYDEGTPVGAYNVHIEAFRNWIISLMTDVVERYDVDGINLDYIRTMGICKSDFCKIDYKEKTDHYFLQDYALSRIDGAARGRIQKWQDDAVGDLVKRLSVAVKRMNPSIIISVDGRPVSKGEKRRLQGRDVISWSNNGWIDRVYTMEYEEKINHKRIDEVMNDLDNNMKLTVLLGNFERAASKTVSPRSGKLVDQLIRYVKRKWPDRGVGLYLYEQLSDEQIQELRRSSFREDSIPNNYNKM
jgi:uncharacterized lipoprotein YddW (UPF0748 family)